MEKELYPENEVSSATATVESHEELHEIDFSNYSKEELLKYVQGLKSETNLSKLNTVLKHVRQAYDNILEHERQEALQRFLETGGEEADFDYRKDEIARDFDKTYKALKDQVHHHYEQQEKNRGENLKKKENILSQLRVLIAESESTSNLEAFRKLQEEWKKTGPVPFGASDELWKKYNALTDMFYSNRSMYFELIDLDRRKNLESKNMIVEKLAQLAKLESIGEALRGLKDLQEEFREVGPVPKEEQEGLRERYKQAVDQLLERRKKYSEEIKEQQEGNYARKMELLKKAEELSAFRSEKTDDWKAKNQEIIAVQKEWKEIGAVPADKVKDLNKNFWNICKDYFKVKNEFFGKLDEKREQNLKQKEELCAEAEALIQHEDLNQAINGIKRLQERWNKTGQPPLKKKEQVWQRFRAACDAVFARRDAQDNARKQEYDDNLSLKAALCAKIEEAINAASTFEVDALKSFQQEWRNIGHVAKTEMANIQDRYNKALETFLSKSNLDAETRQHTLLSLEAAALRAAADGERLIKKKEEEYKRKIGTIKGEIDTYITNMDFFARSKNADALKAEIQQKIDEAKKQMKKLEAELNIFKKA